jgi:hypothetical protein
MPDFNTFVVLCIAVAAYLGVRGMDHHRAAGDDQ